MVEKEKKKKEATAAAEERYRRTAGRIHFPFELRQPEARRPDIRQPEPDYSVWPRVLYYRYRGRGGDADGRIKEYLRRE